MEQPLVSVIMITYGHEKYIKQAIEGIFLQKTNFLIELIIANDCSPDNSNEIIKEVIKNAPKNIIVNYTRHEKNIGMMSNHYWAIQKAKGKYLAICDGDDYWIDENKLKIQANFLENNPDYAICCHNFKVLNGNILSEKSFIDNYPKKDTYTIADLSKRNVIPTLTAFCRNEKIKYPSWYKDAPLGDLILFLNIAKKGKIKYFDNKWAVYRQNVGVWHKNKVNNLKMIKLYDNLANDFATNNIVKNNLIINRNKYIKAYLKQLSFKECISSKYFYYLCFSDKIKLIVRKFL